MYQDGWKEYYSRLMLEYLGYELFHFLINIRIELLSIYIL